MSLGVSGLNSPNKVEDNCIYIILFVENPSMKWEKGKLKENENLVYPSGTRVHPNNFFLNKLQEFQGKMNEQFIDHI